MKRPTAIRPGIALLAALFFSASAFAEPATPVAGVQREVGPGAYRPLYPPSPREAVVSVVAFALDRYPVTNEDYARFVRANPSWKRGAPARILADESYLAHWTSPDGPGPDVSPKAPVVRVSWFAAKAYCAFAGARLPTEAEWELAAMASPTQKDASADKAFLEAISVWYARPNKGPLAPVGRGPANAWGISDLHGLIWEWVSDFNSTLVTSDAREGSGGDRMRFCGASALGARDTTDYVKFMRVALRGSLRADYTTSLLGFRCAKTLPRPDGGAR